MFSDQIVLLSSV